MKRVWMNEKWVGSELNQLAILHTTSRVLLSGLWTLEMAMNGGWGCWADPLLSPATVCATFFSCTASSSTNFFFKRVFEPGIYCFGRFF